MMSTPFPPIERDEEIARTYIPVHQNWEIQTKGTGSSFRIAKRDGSGERWLVLDEHLHDMLTEMALDIHKSQSDAAAIIAEQKRSIGALNMVIAGEGTDAAALASVREALQFANATLRPLYSDPDGAEKELSTLRTQNAEQAERIRELERLVTSQGISSMEDLDENQQLRAALASARAKITAMEIDAEEVLDFDECTAMLLSMDSYYDLTEVGEALDAILSGQSVEDKGERK